MPVSGISLRKIKNPQFLQEMGNAFFPAVGGCQVCRKRESFVAGGKGNDAVIAGKVQRIKRLQGTEVNQCGGWDVGGFSGEQRAIRGGSLKDKDERMGPEKIDGKKEPLL